MYSSIESPDSGGYNTSADLEVQIAGFGNLPPEVSPYRMPPPQTSERSGTSNRHVRVRPPCVQWARRGNRSQVSRRLDFDSMTVLNPFEKLVANSERSFPGIWFSNGHVVSRWDADIKHFQRIRERMGRGTPEVQGSVVSWNNPFSMTQKLYFSSNAQALKFLKQFLEFKYGTCP